MKRTTRRPDPTSPSPRTRSRPAPRLIPAAEAAIDAAVNEALPALEAHVRRALAEHLGVGRRATTPAPTDPFDPAEALRTAARWCVDAHRVDGPTAPSLAPVFVALARAVAAGAQVTRADLDALARALAQWCELASADPHDAAALAPQVHAALEAAGACTCAETRDAPVDGAPFEE